MLRLLLGFVGGIYVGTYYNCKPIVEKVSEYLKNNLPESKNKEETKRQKLSLLEKINIFFKDE
tara:strand:+ start:1210 stop:1398 length:189 start_codon:yes stop_codon:yes gene_type:complete